MELEINPINGGTTLNNFGLMLENGNPELVYCEHCSILHRGSEIGSMNRQWLCELGDKRKYLPESFFFCKAKYLLRSASAGLDCTTILAQISGLPGIMRFPQKTVGAYR